MLMCRTAANTLFNRYIYRDQLAIITFGSRIFSIFNQSSLSFHQRNLIKVAYSNYRIIPKMMKIDTPEFRSLFTADLDVLTRLFAKHNYQLRIAGGAVRDLIMGIKPTDIDFASTATPDEMKQMFESDGIRMLHKRGETHGTITCRINDSSNFEITTLRIDVVCDGRRAEVQFTTDWQMDANRRDLTINSLFLDLDGNVYDYFGGIEDLKRRRVVFVGDAVQRIQEDYLRILRYFRFFGRISEHPDSHDQSTLDAITNNAHGLADVSGERLWTELRKIVVGRFAGPIMKTMLNECRLAEYLGLPIDADVDNFVRISEQCQKLSPQEMTVITALLRNEADVVKLHSKMKLSNAERFLAEFLVKYRDEFANASLDKFRNLLLDETSKIYGAKRPNGRERVCELVKYIGRTELLDDINNWQMPTFPVDGFDLFNVGVGKGPQMKPLLVELFELWKTSNCHLTKDQLLQRAIEISNNKCLSSKPASKRPKIDMIKEKTIDK